MESLATKSLLSTNSNDATSIPRYSIPVFNKRLVDADSSGLSYFPLFDA